MSSPRAHSRGRRAFSLVEVLIVVTIIAILATVIVPLIPEMKRSASETALKQNLVQVRHAILRYRAAHGEFPGERSDGTYAAGTEECFVRQLRILTDRDGRVLTGGETADALGPFIPRAFPKSTVGKLQDQKNVSVVDLPGEIDSDADPTHAWKYNVRTGQFICNCDELSLGDVQPYSVW